MNIFDNILDWIEETLPVKCANCGQWHMKRKMHLEAHITAGIVWLCDRCDKELFQPFGGKHG
jgi:ribosomal protein S27E